MSSNAKTFYGNKTVVSRFTRLAEAAEAVSSLSSEDIDVVILPPDEGNDSEEESVENENIPAEVAGAVELHEGCVSEEESSDEENVYPPAKRSKVHNITWKKMETTKLSDNCKQVANLEESFPDLADKDPFSLFRHFFTMDMISMITNETNRYAKSKNNQTFVVTESEIVNFLGIIIISGYHSLPAEKLYWSTMPSLIAPIFGQIMSRKRFLEIKKYFHLANNDELGSSKTAKVDAIYNELLKNCQQFGIFHTKLSIDESMVPYRGKYPIKQFIRNKPVRFGYKIWFMCGSDGYPYNFQIYKGRDSDSKREPLGSKVVEEMISFIKPEDADKYVLHFDNFFSSYQLFDNLAHRDIRAIGTVRRNRTMKCPLAIQKKDERAKIDYRSDGNILFVQWKDNSIVTVGTNFSSVTPVNKVSRWVKGRGKVSVDQPKLITEYNSGMGGVDLLDMQLASYRPNLTSKKWWWPLFSNALNLAIVAAFKIYKHTSPLTLEKQLSHLEFRIEVAECMSKFQLYTPRVRKGGPTASVPDYIRKDGINHHLISSRQTRCKVCQKNTMLKCSKCDKALHKKICSDIFHS